MLREPIPSSPSWPATTVAVWPGNGVPWPVNSSFLSDVDIGGPLRRPRQAPQKRPASGTQLRKSGDPELRKSGGTQLRKSGGSNQRKFCIRLLLRKTDGITAQICAIIAQCAEIAITNGSESIDLGLLQHVSDRQHLQPH